MGTTNPLLQSALALAALGLRVLPLHTFRAGICSCGDAKCPSAGKHPRIPRGVKGATTDLKKIERGGRSILTPTLALLQATAAGLDVDPRNGGDVTLARLEAAQGPLPKTVIVETGGGGRHYYFRVPAGAPNRCGKVGPGLDVKGEGGYVVVPPSPHDRVSRIVTA